MIIINDVFSFISISERPGTGLTSKIIKQTSSLLIIRTKQWYGFRITDAPNCHEMNTYNNTLGINGLINQTNLSVMFDNYKLSQLNLKYLHSFDAF